MFVWNNDVSLRSDIEHGIRIAAGVHSISRRTFVVRQDKLLISALAPFYYGYSARESGRLPNVVVQMVEIGVYNISTALSDIFTALTTPGSCIAIRHAPRLLPVLGVP